MNARTRPPEPRPTVRIVRLPRGAALALAVPLLLALGVATIATFVVGMAALALAPRVRERGRGARRHEGRVVTLEASAYRRLDDDTRDVVVERERS